MVNSKDHWKAWLYLSPAIVLLLIFTVWPIINTVRMSLLEGYSGLKAASGASFEFGLGNFVKVIKYRKFLTCLQNTVLLCLWTVPISTILALLIAVALNSIKFLQKALQTVLGDHVHQAGSYVEPDRLRFDFTHYSALTPEELVKVNAIVQNSILEGYNIVTREMPVDEAKAMGATALFSEKYGSTVRVVNMGNYSIELCGGTHLDNTAKVGPFEIESECSVASGVRRIEAITGKACLERMERNQTMLLEAAAKLKTKPIELGTRIQAQLEELRELRRTIEAYKAKETVGEIDRILFGSHNVDGLKVITASVPNADTGRLRQMGDVLRDKDASVVAVLATVNEGKITFLAVCGKDAIARGIKAGDLVKQVCCCCGGSGGGKPDSAMGGGKDVTKVDNALAIVDDYVVSKLK